MTPTKTMPTSAAFLALLGGLGTGSQQENLKLSFYVLIRPQAERHDIFVPVVGLADIVLHTLTSSHEQLACYNLRLSACISRISRVPSVPDFVQAALACLSSPEGKCYCMRVERQCHGSSS